MSRQITRCKANLSKGQIRDKALKNGFGCGKSQSGFQIQSIAVPPLPVTLAHCFVLLVAVIDSVAVMSLCSPVSCVMQVNAPYEDDRRCRTIHLIDRPLSDTMLL